MSAPGLLWVLSELFGAKLGAVGRLTNQQWGSRPVVSLVEKLPRTAPLISLWDRRMGTEEAHTATRPSEEVFPGKHKMRRWQSWIIWELHGNMGLGQNLNEFRGKYPENSRDLH